MAEFSLALTQLSMGMADAEVLHWLVQVGDVVDVGQAIVEVDAAKASVEIVAPVAGKIVRLCRDRGDIVDVGEVLAVIDEG